MAFAHDRVSSTVQLFFTDNAFLTFTAARLLSRRSQVPNNQ